MVTVLYFSIINVFWLLNLCAEGGHASFATQTNLVTYCFDVVFYNIVSYITSNCVIWHCGTNKFVQHSQTNHETIYLSVLIIMTIFFSGAHLLVEL